MPLSPENFLRALHDAFTPVRDETGRLLGCIPKVRDDDIFVGPFPLQWCAQVCLTADLHGPNAGEVSSLPGFIPLDDSQVDLLIPIGDMEDEP